MRLLLNVVLFQYLVETKEAQQQLRDVESRHQELLEIESHLTKIRDLFVQIAILVEQQVS